MLVFLGSLIALGLGYAAGSLSSAVLVCRAFNLPDPREAGSGNPGATNVLRLGGKKAAALTLAGDVLKGFLPVVVVCLLSPKGVETPYIMAGLGAFIGHLYPYFFGFKGGKGVATAFGVILAISPIMALFVAAMWVFVFYKTKISSLSALCAIAFAPLAALFVYASTKFFLLILFFCYCLMIRHKENIERLKKGEEKPFDFSKVAS
ncbi:MAG: glycerol-3-phosphate 1-O-acyltransferase PlsY [Cardiobacteriaceae bacterium]|nr:glycerol-3-phosphate 1-O-acyltransferase PlsY [Cardiobacteriaceae bacterium]